jgi:hypothetical protein
MQVKPLYLPLKDVQGGFDFVQYFTFKTLKHIERYGELPKKGWRGYHHKRLIADSDVTAHSDRLKAHVLQRVEWLLKKSPQLSAQLDKEDNPHWNTPAAAFKKQRSKLLKEVSSLVRYKCVSSTSPLPLPHRLPSPPALGGRVFFCFKNALNASKTFSM